MSDKTIDDVYNLVTEQNELLTEIRDELVKITDLKTRVEETLPDALESMKSNPFLSGVARALGGAFK